MPPEVVAAPAAPVAPSSAPGPAPLAESVKRFQETAAPTPAEESSKGFRSLDDAFEKHFKHLAKSTPSEAEEAYKEKKGKPKEEKKEEPRAEAKEPEQKAEAKEPEAKLTKIVDPETIKAPSTLKGDNLTGWNTMKANSKLLHNENQKLSEKVKALETVVTQKGGMSQKEIETLKSQIEELKPFRQMVDLQHDPDFRKSYDEPMETARKSIHKILRDLQTPEETLAKIDFLNPMQVDKVVAVMEEAGQKTLSRRILAHADELQKLNDKRQEALGSSKEKFSEFSKNREQAEAAKRVEEEAIISRTVDGAFTMKEIPANATKEQIDQIEAYNKGGEALVNHVHELLKANDAESRANIAIRAVAGDLREAQLTAALKELEEVRAELKRVSVAGSEKKSVAASKPTGERPRTAEESMQNFFASRKR